MKDGKENDKLIKSINNSLKSIDDNFKSLDKSDKIIMMTMQFSINTLLDYDEKLKEYFTNSVSFLLKNEDIVKDMHPYFLSYLESLTLQQNEAFQKKNAPLPTVPPVLRIIKGGKSD